MKLRIEKAIYGGDGLARIPPPDSLAGKTVFVPATLPGELVEARIAADRRSFATGELDADPRAVPGASRARLRICSPAAAAASTSTQTPPTSCR